MAVETIGARRKRMAEQLGQEQSLLPSQSPQLGYTPESRINAPNPQGGRHRPEYIRSQGETPRYVLQDKAPVASPVLFQTQQYQEERLPRVLPMRSLPQRVPVYHQPDVAHSDHAPELTTLVSSSKPLQEQRLPPILPIRSLPQRIPVYNQPEVIQPDLAPEPVTLAALSEPEPVLQPEPVAIKRIAPLGTTHRVARGRASVTSASEVTSSPEPTNPPTERRSATETHIHARKKRRIPRKVLAATAALAVAGGLVGGLALWKKHSPTQPEQQSVELVLPVAPQHIETQPPVVTPTPITETGIISAQDGNQWNTAARKTTAALGHASTPVTNIVAQTEAYDSRATSPDPDNAHTGDAFTVLTGPAIEIVDRLQQTPEPTASQAEIDAAKIIYKLNNLNPMEIQALIAQYGDEIEELKNDISDILTPPAEKAFYQAPQVSEKNTQAALASEKKSGELKQKQTTIVSFFADKVANFSQRRKLARVKRASAALTRSRLRRQRQPSYAK